MFEFISNLLNGFYELLFVLYIILFIVMGITGFIGIASPIYFVSELIMLLIGFAIYKTKYVGPNNFRVCWMTASMIGFLGYVLIPVVGPFVAALVSLIIRVLMFKNMIS